MHAYEQLGAFYLGRPYDVATRSAQEGGVVLYDSRDLMTHAVIVGMTGSGKTGLGIGAARGGRDRRRARDRHRSQGRPGQPAADLSRSLAPRTSARGSTKTRRRRAGHDAGRVRAGAGRAGSRGSRRGARMASGSRGCGPRSTSPIYTPGSSAGLPICGPEVVRRAAAEIARRPRAAARPGQRRVTGLLDAGRHRRRSGAEPRAHPAVDHPRPGLARRAGSRRSRA